MTLIITIISLVIMTMIVLFAANYGVFEQKITRNIYRNTEAYEAAEAGIEFVIPYLALNKATLLANKVNGYIQPITNNNITNVILSNGSQYSITYTNPIANNYNLLLLTSSGISSDNTSTRTIQQLVQFGSQLSKTPQSTIISQGIVSLAGNTNITNKQTNITIQSGKNITFQGSSQTTTSTGKSSSPSGLKNDVQQNNASLASMTPSDLFATYFGISSSSFKNNVANYYNNNSNTNYSSSLNGKVGTTIWIDQSNGSATINGNTTIGSPTQPVILIVNGNLSLSGNLTIYGMVYEMGGSTTTDVLGTVNITGGLVTSGALNLSGNTGITFDSAIFSNIINNNGYFAKVPGSWKDF